MSGNYVYKEYDNLFDRDDAVNEYRQQCPECGAKKYMMANSDTYTTKCRHYHTWHVHLIGEKGVVFVKVMNTDQCDVCTGRKIYV